MTASLPEGYTAHDGGDCPVDPEQTVDCIVRTAEGLGHSGAMRARLQDWRDSSHPGGIGAILGYRTAVRGENIDIYSRWPE